MRARYFIAILYLMLLFGGVGCARHARAQSPPPGPPSSGGPMVHPGGQVGGSRCNRKRVPSGTINVGNYVDVSVPWITPFTDASYTVFCSVLNSTSGSAGLLVDHVQAVAAGSVTVTVYNGALAPLAGTVECIGIHD